MQQNIPAQAMEIVTKIINVLPINDDELAMVTLAISFMAVCNTLNMSKAEIIAAFTAIVEAEEISKKAKEPLAS